MKFKTKYYHTLKDFRGDNNTWTNIIGYSSESTTSQTSLKLLQEFIIPRYEEGIIDITDTETTEYTYLKSKIYAWLNSTYPYYSKLISLYETEESKLMDKLTSETSRNLINTRSGGNTNTLRSGPQKSTTRENDTPQNGGYWEDDEHTSSISTSEYGAYTNTYDLVYNNQKIADTGTMTTEADPDTIINRLDDIRKKYINFYEKWCEDFRRFIYFPAEYEVRTPLGIKYE